MQGIPEEAVRQLGAQLATALDGSGLAFILIIGRFNETGQTCYASNVQRSSVREALDELAATLKELES